MTREKLEGTWKGRGPDGTLGRARGGSGSGPLFGIALSTAGGQSRPGKPEVAVRAGRCAAIEADFKDEIDKLEA